MSQCVEKVTAAFSLERVYGCWDLLDDADELRVASFEPPPLTNEPRVSWLSWTESKRGHELSAWNGPLTTVPHLRAALSWDEDGGVNVSVDFVPRLDGGYYDMAPDAEPRSRAEFAMRSSRRDLDSTYFTPQLRAWRRSLEETTTTTTTTRRVETVAPPMLRVQSRLGAGARGDDRGSVIHGPLYADLRGLDQDAALATITEAVEVYCAWLEAAPTTTADASSWMTSRLVYDRDCLVRAKLYQTHLGQLIDAGRDEDAARQVASAVAGKMDMVGHNSLGLGRDD